MTRFASSKPKGPWRPEIPTPFKEAYAKYHGQGFEIVGISLDPKGILDSFAGSNGLEFTLVDRGQPLDPARVCARPLDAVEIGGLGTHIIRQVMDRVDYEQRPGANQVRLVKYLKGTR